jgi:hypothetical protein
VYSCEPTFDVFSHGYNGDCSFTELEDCKETLEDAKALAEEIMLERRWNNTHNGQPTIKWIEIFGPDIEESIGCEMISGNLTFTGA